jgi:hypothetical protein
MRFSVSTMIVWLTMALPAMSWSPPPTQRPEPVENPPVSGRLADGVATQGQPDGACGACEACEPGQPCEGEEEPGPLASMVGRFLNQCECEPHWWFSADAVALQRSSTRNQPLFTGAPAVVAVPDPLNAQNLEFPVAFGFQLDAVHRGPSGCEWELGYFQIDGFDANANVAGSSVMVTGSDGTGVLGRDGQAHYGSAIHLAEINLRKQWDDGLTVLVGFRTGELDELYSAGVLNANGGFGGSSNINTFNHLYGFQTGAIYEFYNMGGALRISALCKAGIYGNSAIQSSRVITGVDDDTLAAHRNQLAFMGEAGAVATYQVTSHLSFRASCQAMWIEGVALAPEQIGANDFTTLTPGIDTHGGIFYYGGGLGAELKF